ncbi:MAG: hypothetical protein JHC26_09840 [Thermofilum sp.]|jgi:hypothetical protein|uniref:hypothetical protein n=1 Tax=Thermofilum sp. TaxID=1961369 RepID=UPI002583125C|nr:hypothetical protein [Thermofilum sp.]MCI4409383.1 hypothetical protein [Thermofilum sp.]
MRDRKEEEEQIERITLLTFSIYLVIYIAYMVLVGYVSLVNYSMLDSILAWDYVIPLLPIPMFFVAERFMPRGWWYTEDKRTNFVVYLYLVYAVVFLGNWTLVFMTKTPHRYPMLFGLMVSIGYMCLFIYYFLKH